MLPRPLKVEQDFTDARLCEHAVLARHKPDGWAEYPCVMVRKFLEGAQGELFPVHTVILVS